MYRLHANGTGSEKTEQVELQMINPFPYVAVLEKWWNLAVHQGKVSVFVCSFASNSEGTAQDSSTPWPGEEMYLVLLLFYCSCNDDTSEIALTKLPDCHQLV